MAKKRRSKNARLKKNAAIRSRQVANNAVSRMSTINPAKLSKGTLDKLSRPQLETLAKKTGEAIAVAKNASERYQSSRLFLDTPPVSLTKNDIVFSQRKIPTKQQIASAPPRKAKLLRQQQRKITAARRKVENWRQYNAQLMQNVDIKTRQKAVSGGLSDEKTRQRDGERRASSDIEHLGRYRNVLKNPNIVAHMSDKELRDEIGARQKDLRLSQNLIEGTTPKISDKDNDYFAMRLRAGFGEELVRQWNSLSREDRYNLLNQTSILNRVEYYSIYDEDINQFVAWNNDAGSSKADRDAIVDFMRHAKSISGLRIE